MIDSTAPQPATPLLTGVTVAGNRITYHLHPVLRQLHVTDDLWIRYPDGVDLTTMPEAIRLLPAAYYFAPLVWVFDRSFTLPTLDERVLRSFTEIRDYFRVIFPGLTWSGNLHSSRTEQVEPASDAAFEAAALFTGGVDSTYTMLAHGDEHLLLISMWEARTGRTSPNASYSSWFEEAKKSTERLGHCLTRVETNAGRIVDRRRVGLDVSRRQHIGNWWAEVHFGMALASLVAPLLYHHGVPLLYIAGGSTSERMLLKHLPPDAAVPDESTASSPNVDDRITLGPARVLHDSYRVTRQQKIDAIASQPALMTDGGFPLRVCLLAPYDESANCGNCEKCLRTISSLVVAGADPRRFGFPEYRTDTLTMIRSRFARRKMALSPVRAMMWQASQESARQRIDQSPGLAEAEYLRWLSDFSFDSYHRALRRRRPFGMLRRIAHIPLLPSAYLKLRIVLARWAARRGR